MPYNSLRCCDFVVVAVEHRLVEVAVDNIDSCSVVRNIVEGVVVDNTLGAEFVGNSKMTLVVVGSLVISYE